MVCSLIAAPYGEWQIHLTYDGRPFFDQYSRDAAEARAHAAALQALLQNHGWNAS